MGFFNNLTKVFSASKGKQASYACGGFEAAANYSKDRSYIYTAPLEETINPQPYTRREILNLARYLVNNFALMERILSVAEIYGVGNGLIANAATSDSEFNDTATEAFDRWANNVFASSNNQYTLYELQKLVVRELLIAGEVFMVLIKSPDSGYPQLMPVASENVKHSGEDSDASIDGLYVDDFGKVTAYNIFTGERFRKVPASDVVHLMRHKQIGQFRGVSAFAASLNDMRDIKDLQVIEKKALKVQSSIAAVVTKKNGQAGDGIFGDLTPQTKVGETRPSYGLERAFPGAIHYADEGEDVKLISAERTSEGFTKFIELLGRNICLNLSIPYEFLVNSEKLTGVGIRFVLNDASFFFGALQTLLIDGALNRIYGWVIGSFIKRGDIRGPSNDDLASAVSWTRPISITIDSQRVSNTEISLLQNSLLTYEGYWAARGKDYREELRQRAREEAFLDELAKETGVDVNRLRSLAAGAAPIAAAPDAEEPQALTEEEEA